MKASYGMIWDGRVGRTKTRKQEVDPKVVSRKFVKLGKAKFNVLAEAAATFPLLEQGNLSLPKWINKASVLGDYCECSPKILDRLL